MSDYESLLSDATQLPIGDRIQLIEALWNTVPEDSLPPLSNEWMAEIQLRSAEYDAGAVQPISWERVRQEAFRRAGLTVPDEAN